MASDRSGGFLESPENWVAIGFVVFFAFAGKKLWRALVGMLDKHSETVARQIDQAASLRKEAEALLADAKRQFERAKLEADRLSIETQAAAARLRDRLRSEMEVDLARRQKAALDKIARAEVLALAEVRAETVRIAIEATGKLLAAHVDGGAAGASIDRAISELPSLLN